MSTVRCVVVAGVLAVVALGLGLKNYDLSTRLTAAEFRWELTAKGARAEQRVADHLAETREWLLVVKSGTYHKHYMDLFIDPPSVSPDERTSLKQLQEKRDRLLGCLEALAASPAAVADLPSMAGSIAGKTQVQRKVV